MENHAMTADQKNYINKLKIHLKNETDKRVITNKQLFANLSKEGITKEKKRLAEDFKRKERNTVLPYKILSEFGFTEDGAQKLIDSYMGWIIPLHLDLFEGLDNKEWLWKIAGGSDSRGVDNAKEIFENLSKFKGLEAIDYQKLAQKDLRSGGQYAAGYLGNFKYLDKETAKLFINKGYFQQVAMYLDSFNGLDQEVF